MPKLAQAQPVPIAIVVVAVLGSLVTRAERWRLFFLPDRRVPFVPLLETLAISYMASTFLPLRAGEIVRAVFLGLRQSIAVPRVVGTILLEKLFDFLAIGVMLVLLVALAPSRPEVQVGAGFIGSVILIGFGFVVALAVLRTRTLRLVKLIEDWLPFGLGRRLRLEHAATEFAEGTDSLRVPKLWVPLLSWTAITWICALATSWAGCLALGAAPGLAALLFLIVLTSSGQAVPSSPGYVGVYHYLATLALTTFGVDPATALGVAFIIHAFSYGPLVVAGLIALWTGGYTFGDVLAGSSRRKLGSSSAASVVGAGVAAEAAVRPLARDPLDKTATPR